MKAVRADDRCDAIYRSRFADGESGWHDAATATEIRALLLELLREVASAGVGGGDALELGCGTGSLTRTLADAGFDVLALDISSAAIDRARRSGDSGAVASAARGRCVFEVHDVTIPRPDTAGRFAVVLDSLMLHCITDRAARVRTAGLAARAMRPGGALLVMTVCGAPRRKPPGSVFDPVTRCLTTHGTAEVYYTTPAELEGLFAAEGLIPTYRRVHRDGASGDDPDFYLGVFRHAALGSATADTFPGALQ